MRTDVRVDAQRTIELTAQLTTFMRTDVRADAQTPTELTARLTTFPLTTFVKIDVRADAQTTTRSVWVDRSVNHIPDNHMNED